MTTLTLDEHRAAMRASRIDRLAALLRTQHKTYADCDPLLVEELSDALAQDYRQISEDKQP